MNKCFWVLAVWVVVLHSAFGQDVWSFTSIVPAGQSDSLILPDTHCFQVLAQAGDTLSDGTLLRNSGDFTGFVPINGSSLHGLLSLNHEIPAPLGGITVFDADFDTAAHLWSLTNGSQVDFLAVPPISRACSGTVTRWGNVISGEEIATTTDVDSNGYHDEGWLVETNPTTRAVVAKLYRAGKMVHENAVIAADNRTMYFGADDVFGFIYKFVADEPEDFREGSLYVLGLTGLSFPQGIWIAVPNSTPEQCNGVRQYAAASGATNFGPIEDVDIAPDGSIYFSNKATGRIYRMESHPTLGIVSNFEVFVEPGTYTVQTPNGSQEVVWGNGADNLAFDLSGNLWVCHDSYSPFTTSINYLWVIGASHTTANPNMRIFLSGPAISESTGLTFSPDNRFMFLSFQVINDGIDYVAKDVNDKPVNFNRGTTVVIARKEVLGPNATVLLSSVNENTLPSKSLQLSMSPSPIPSGGELHIAIEGELYGTAHIQMRNLEGQTVCQGTIDARQIDHGYKWKIPAVASGVYIVTLTSAEQTISEIVVVYN